MPRRYIDAATGKTVATIDDDMAREVDDLKAARDAIAQAEADGLLGLPQGEIENIDLIYREGRPNEIDV